MRIVVILFLLAILFSLGSAFFYMVRNKGKTDPRVVQRLSMRVGLSVALFALLMIGHRLGWIGDRL